MDVLTLLMVYGYIVGSAGSTSIDRDEMYYLRQEMRSIKDEIKGLQSDKVHLKSEMLSMKDEIRSLQSDKALLKSEIVDLDNLTSLMMDTIQKQSEEIAALREDKRRMDFNDIKEHLDSIEPLTIQTEPSGMKAELNDIIGIDGNKEVTDNDHTTVVNGANDLSTESNDTFINGIKERGILEPNEYTSAPPTVAFSALVTVSDLVHLRQGQTIVFDKVISNLGNGYSNRDGHFRVPSGGWYVFSLTLMSVPNERQSLQVLLNGNSVFHCYSEGVKFNTGSRTIVAHADTGDYVWVETGPWVGDNVHGDGHTSFTAFLLYTD